MEEINLIHYAIPFFIILIVIEVTLASYQHKQWYDTKDAASSLAMGIGNVITGLITKGLIFGAFTFMYQYRLFTLGNAWWVWVLLFFADDFSYYWFHRTAHSVRFFWASHVVHHSAQTYNLAVALRQTWTGNLTGNFVFWMWLPLVGFHPIQVLTMQSISLLYQFWIHTEAIDKLPRWFEYIFNTPSHHRVHHGSDIEYLDTNHGGMLIIWDRLFGTFTPETKHPTYGLVTNLESHNPFVIAFYEWYSIGKDIFKAQTWRDVWHYLFGPPGWSPDGSRLTTAQLRAQQKTQPPKIDVPL